MLHTRISISIAGWACPARCAGRLQTSANLRSQGVYSLAGTEGCLFVQGGLEEQGCWQVTAAPALPQHRGHLG